MSEDHYVDINAWSGTWPFGSGETVALADVSADLQRVGVREAWVSPLDAVLAAHPTRANSGLIAEVVAVALPSDDFTVRIVPIIDPSLADGTTQLAVATELAGDRLCAIRIVPNYHGYALDHPAADALAQTLVDRNLPLIVQVRMFDERAHHPRMVMPPVPMHEIAAFGRRHPDLRIIASGIFFGELGVIADVPNVAVELSSIETGETVPDVLAGLSPERVLLGTHVPLYVPDAAIAKLDGEGISRETLSAIGAGNARSLSRASLQRTPSSSSSSMEGNRS
jgi:hypothetical protein